MPAPSRSRTPAPKPFEHADRSPSIIGVGPREQRHEQHGHHAAEHREARRRGEAVRDRCARCSERSGRTCASRGISRSSQRPAREHRLVIEAPKCWSTHGGAQRGGHTLELVVVLLARCRCRSAPTARARRPRARARCRSAPATRQVSGSAARTSVEVRAQGRGGRPPADRSARGARGPIDRGDQVGQAAPGARGHRDDLAAERGRRALRASGAARAGLVDHGQRDRRSARRAPGPGATGRPTARAGSRRRRPPPRRARARYRARPAPSNAICSSALRALRL